MNNTPKAPLLALDGIKRHFQQGGETLRVLDGASLEVYPGEMTALVGPSGSGKSTLLNIAGLLERPNSGGVTVDGIDANQLTRRKRGQLRQSHIGFVFQFHRLLPEFSALENVMIPQMLNGLSRKESVNRAMQLLGMVGLESRASHRPAELSGGEQQRVAIARAVANAPKVLLADEPTGNLDPETGKDVFNHLAAIVRATNTAALIVTHNQNLAAAMDKAVTIDNGKVMPVGLASS
jgi:lipoprotein-releasing system ATP-binding protein